MKSKKRSAELSESFWLIRFFLVFGIQLFYIALILLTEELFGSLLAFLPLVLMPLFECVFGGVYGFLTYGRSGRKAPVFYSALGGLALAGLLYEVAAGILRGWSLDGGVLLYDLVLIFALVVGILFGIRFMNLKRKIRQRRSRFDE